MPLRREDVQSFLDRDWARARMAKDAAVFVAVRRRGVAHAFELAQGLLTFIDASGAGATAADRRRDYQDLLRLKERLTRASSRRRATAD